MSNIDDWKDVPLDNSQVDDWQDVPVQPEAPIAPQDITKTESAIRGAADGALASFSGEAEALGRSAYDIARGTVAVPVSKDNPFPGRPGTEVPGLLDNYRGNRDIADAANEAAQKANPITYGASQFGGAAASSLLPGGLVGQAALQGLGASKADLTKGEFVEALADTGEAGLKGLATGLVLKGAGAALGGAKNFIADTKYGQAFSGGSGVQKFTSKGSETDLANRVSAAIEEKVSAARLRQMEARKGYLDQVGDKTLDTSDVVKKSYESANRAGPGVMGADGKIMGAMSPKERAMLDNYTATIAEPKSAQELYTVWDDLKRETDTFDNILQGKESEINNQLKGLMGGIKEKLRSLGAGLPEADDAYSAFADKTKHLNRATNETTNESFLSTLGTKNKGNRQAAFEDVLSDNPALLKEVDNFQTYKSFEGQGGTGSMPGVRNLTGVGSGASLGFAAGGPVGLAAGSVAGAIVANPQIQRKVLAGAGDFSEAIMSALPKLPPQYSQLLGDAAKRGGNSLAITHFMLGNQDPKYQAATKKEDK